MAAVVGIVDAGGQAYGIEGVSLGEVEPVEWPG